MKLLKSDKEKLLSIKNMQRQEYQKRKQYEKELQTVCKNVEMILHGKSDFEKNSEKNIDVYKRQVIQNTTVGVFAVIFANPPIPANAPGPLCALMLPYLSTSRAPIKQTVSYTHLKSWTDHLDI